MQFFGDEIHRCQEGQRGKHGSWERWRVFGFRDLMVKNACWWNKSETRSNVTKANQERRGIESNEKLSRTKKSLVCVLGTFANKKKSCARSDANSYIRKRLRRPTREKDRKREGTRRRGRFVRVLNARRIWARKKQLSVHDTANQISSLLFTCDAYWAIPPTLTLVQLLAVNGNQ